MEPVIVRQALLGLLTLVRRALYRIARLSYARSHKRGAVEIQIAVEAAVTSLALYEADAVESVRVAEELVALFGGQLVVETGEENGQPLVRVMLAVRAATDGVGGG